MNMWMIGFWLVFLCYALLVKAHQALCGKFAATGKERDFYKRLTAGYDAALRGTRQANDSLLVENKRLREQVVAARVYSRSLSTSYLQLVAELAALKETDALIASLSVENKQLHDENAEMRVYIDGVDAQHEAEVLEWSTAFDAILDKINAGKKRSHKKKV